MYLVAIFWGILVPASDRHSLNFSILIKLLHTPSTPILAHSYFCLSDSLNYVPWAYKNSPCPLKLRRQTGLWSWWGVLTVRPPRRNGHWELLVMYLYYSTRKYVSTRTKTKPHNINNTEKVSMRDLLAEGFFFSWFLATSAMGNKKQREKVQLFLLCRSQDGFPWQNISDSFTIPPRSLQLTENSVWKRNWRPQLRVFYC